MNILTLKRINVGLTVLKWTQLIEVSIARKVVFPKMFPALICTVKFTPSVQSVVKTITNKCILKKCSKN